MAQELDMDRVVATRSGPQGEVVPVTVAERIYETMRLGGYLDDAAKRVATTRQSIYNWLTAAAKIRSRVLRGEVGYEDLPENEQRYLAFADGFDQAETEGKMLLLGLLERSCRGGIPLTTTTTKRNRHGQIESIIEKVEETLPDAASIRWRLERRFPTEWGYRQSVEVAGAGGGPIQVEDRSERAKNLAESLRTLGEQGHLPVGNGAPRNGNGATTQ